MKIHMLLKATVLTVGFVSSISISHANFNLVTDALWDNTAVRRVLHTFAYGGFASDAQIQAWADMPPQTAIAQILTFAPTNDLLSPPEADNIQSHLQVGGKDRTLQALQEVWMDSANLDNRYATLLNPGAVRLFKPLPSAISMLDNYSMKYTWIAATNKRGLNPFRQRVGVWLTDYIMSVHTDAAQSFVPVRTMYDEAMDMLAQGSNFAAVLGDGAASAAIAIQYGHRNNTYNKVTGQFNVNDDFAREFNQLFFGIHGVRPGYAESTISVLDPLCKLDPACEYKQYYENYTVKNTANALTGMQMPGVYFYNGKYAYASDQINFQSTQNVNNHFSGALEILNFFAPRNTTNVTGATAEAKLANLAQIAINDPESELNLPVKIASYFADDNLDDPTKTALRSGWKASGKNLLSFLRAYAVSQEFHSVKRVKYMNAVDRNMRIYLQNTVDNTESYLNYNTGGYGAMTPNSRIQAQDAELFHPKHFVFGGQTGVEAANNSQVFKQAYNANVIQHYQLGLSGQTIAVANPTYPDLTTPYWMKDWAKLIPKDINGNYVAGDVARWLWNHFIGDGGKNYGIQERAYITALLATGIDFLTQVSPTSPVLTGYTDGDLQTNSALSGKIAANESTVMNLGSATAAQRQAANVWVGMAVNFITVTPFMFAQEGL